MNIAEIGKPGEFVNLDVPESGKDINVADDALGASGRSMRGLVSKSTSRLDSCHLLQHECKEGEPS